MARLTFKGETFEVDAGITLKKAFAQLGIPFTFPCGGRKACGKCRVVVKEGQASPLCEDEERLLSPTLIQGGIRLACCTVIEGDLEIEAFTSESGFLTETGAPTLLPTDGAEGIGLALDIGTTTLAAAFYDMKTGSLLKEYSALNPQLECGLDVLSRIEFAQKEGGQKRLQELIIASVNGFIEDFGKDVNLLCVGGNTAMELIFAGIDVTPLGEYPFTPPSLLGTYFKGESLGLKGVKEVYLMPCAGAFMGGDAIASALYGGMWGAKEPTFLADLGTNCELMATADGERFFALSAAAGPAFEGGEITCGCGSVTGAICKVKSLVATPEVETVGRQKPVGICGSGLIDALAVGRREGLISPDGLLGSYSPLEQDQRRINLTGKVYLTQTDIRKAQLAKAAVAAGGEILLKKLTATPRKTLLTGGFGKGVDPLSAAEIGLFPSPLTEEIIPLGNGALKGTAMALLKNEEREKAQLIAKNTTVISPTEEREFEDIFTKNLTLGK